MGIGLDVKVLISCKMGFRPMISKASQASPIRSEASQATSQVWFRYDRQGRHYKREPTHSSRVLFVHIVHRRSHPSLLVMTARSHMLDRREENLFDRLGWLKIVMFYRTW